MLWDSDYIFSSVFFAIRSFAGVYSFSAKGSCSIIFQGSKASIFISLQPSLMLDTVRIWAYEQGAHVFPSWGWCWSPGDSLFEFKVGFSRRLHDFSIWRWVVLPDVCRKLCAERERWNSEHGLKLSSSGYFPTYRSPVFLMDRDRLVLQKRDSVSSWSSPYLHIPS